MRSTGMGLWHAHTMNVIDLCEAAVVTSSHVQECLILVEKRETRYRVQWYYQLFAETSRGLRAGMSF